MSEPIFRAWSNNGKFWLNDFYLNHNGEIYLCQNSDLGFRFDKQDATLCRSTGLRDKHGKIIFEGDIVEFEPFNPNHCEGDYLPQQIFEVSVKRLRYWLKEESFGYEGELLLSSENCEIIGNVLENPELLEQKQ